MTYSAPLATIPPSDARHVDVLAGAAARMYTRFLQGDQEAESVISGITVRSRMGHASSQKAHACILDTHARAQFLGWGSLTPEQALAAQRLYARLQAKDPTAWEDLNQIRTSLVAGDLGARRSHWALSMIHKARTQGPGTGEAPVSLDSNRVTDLVAMARQAKLGPVAGLPLASSNTSTPASTDIAATSIYRALPPAALPPAQASTLSAFSRIMARV